MSLMNPMSRFWDYLSIITIVSAVIVGVGLLIAVIVL